MIIHGKRLHYVPNTGKYFPFWEKFPLWERFLWRLNTEKSNFTTIFNEYDIGGIDFASIGGQR